MAGDFARGLLAILLFLPLPLWAQNAAPDAEDDVVGQTLSWEGSEGALDYELTIQELPPPEGSGQEVFHQKLEVPSVELHLPPNTYRYRIVVHNILEQVEDEGEWLPLVVERAEIPRARTVTPDTLYLEEPAPKYLVAGVLLKEGASYRLTRHDAPEDSTSAAVLTHTSDEDVVLAFPDFEFSIGNYDLMVENPGGLKRTLVNALKVRYSKPVDFHLLTGYTPSIPVADPWYTATWAQGFYPLGANARLEVMFLKRTIDQWGLSLDANAWWQTGGLSTARIHSRYQSGGLSVVYQYIFSPQWRALGRLGGGLTSSGHSFDYGTATGASWSSVDPYASVELGGSYWFTKNWYVEAGVELLAGFNNGYVSANFKPNLMAGFGF